MKRKKKNHTHRCDRISYLFIIYSVHSISLIAYKHTHDLHDVQTENIYLIWANSIESNKSFYAIEWFFLLSRSLSSVNLAHHFTTIHDDTQHIWFCTYIRTHRTFINVWRSVICRRKCMVKYLSLLIFMRVCVWIDGWMNGWLVDWSVGWLAGWLVGWIDIFIIL